MIEYKYNYIKINEYGTEISIDINEGNFENVQTIDIITRENKMVNAFVRTKKLEDNKIFNFPNALSQEELNSYFDNYIDAYNADNPIPQQTNVQF